MNSHVYQACAQWVTTVAQWIHQGTGHGSPLQMQENAKAQGVMLKDVKTKEAVQSWDSCQWTQLIQRRRKFEVLQDLQSAYLEHLTQTQTVHMWPVAHVMGVPSHQWF